METGQYPIPAYIPSRHVEQSLIQYLYAPTVGAYGEFHGPERPEYQAVSKAVPG